MNKYSFPTRYKWPTLSANVQFQTARLGCFIVSKSVHGNTVQPHIQVEDRSPSVPQNLPAKSHPTQLFASHPLFIPVLD